MPVVVPDTSVLIALYRDEARAAEVLRNGWLFRISSVVQAELRCGAATRQEIRDIEDLGRAVKPIAPTASQWLRCGEVLFQVRREHGFEERGIRNLRNDVLIAITARDLGVPVVTANVADFELVRRYLRLRVIEFPAAS